MGSVGVGLGQQQHQQQDGTEQHRQLRSDDRVSSRMWATEQRACWRFHPRPGLLSTTALQPVNRPRNSSFLRWRAGTEHIAAHGVEAFARSVVELHNPVADPTHLGPTSAAGYGVFRTDRDGMPLSSAAARNSRVPNNMYDSCGRTGRQSTCLLPIVTYSPLLPSRPTYLFLDLRYSPDRSCLIWCIGIQGT